MGTTRNKIIAKICKGAPLIIIQLALFGWMLVFSVKGAFEEFTTHKVIAWLYSIYMILIFFLCIASLFKVYITEPGYVTKALIEKLKHQLLQPK